MSVIYTTCKKNKGKLKYIWKEQKTIKGDLADLKENQMLLLEIKNAGLKLKPQWVGLAALMEYFWIEHWISMHIESPGATTERTETKCITSKLVEGEKWWQK